MCHGTWFSRIFSLLIGSESVATSNLTQQYVVVSGFFFGGGGRNIDNASSQDSVSWEIVAVIFRESAESEL